MITGTGLGEGGSGLTTDKAAQHIMQLPELNIDQTYACAFGRQSMQLLLITKLLHILHLISLAEQNRTLLEPFANNCPSNKWKRHS